MVGLGENARQSLRDGYSYSANYSDGEIFRHVRRSQLAGNTLEERRWRSRYSKAKERKLKLLLKRPVLLNALDSILPVRGLWKAFHAGSLDFLVAQRCDEVCFSYSFKSSVSKQVATVGDRFPYRMHRENIQ